MKKYLHIIFFSCLIQFCTKSGTEVKPVFTVNIDPSYVPFSIGYAQKSPVFHLLNDGTLYFSKQDSFFVGKLTENEISQFISGLKEHHLFNLTMDTISVAGYDVGEIDGSMVHISYNLEGKIDTLNFGYLTPLTEIGPPEDAPWYSFIGWEIAQLNNYWRHFRPENYEYYNGSYAAVFIDCKKMEYGCTGSLVSTGDDSFYIEKKADGKKSKRWPFTELNLEITSENNWQKVKEVVINDQKIIDAITSKEINSGEVFTIGDTTFAIYYRPIFSN